MLNDIIKIIAKYGSLTVQTKHKQFRSSPFLNLKKKSNRTKKKKMQIQTLNKLVVMLINIGKMFTLKLIYRRGKSLLFKCCCRFIWSSTMF